MKTPIRSFAPSCSSRAVPPLALLAVAVMAAWLQPRPSTAQVLWPNLSVVDGTVDAIAASDSVIYIGGRFTRVGPPTGSWVRIRQSTGAPIPPYPLVAGKVNACSPDGHGGWIIGGFFSAVGGVPRANLARLDGNGNLMSWNPGTDQDVLAIVVSGNTVYIGGVFLNVAGQSRSNIAALDLDTGVPTPFNPGANGSVNALAFGGGLLYASGQFTTIGGQSRHYIAQLGLDGSVGGWNPNPNGAVWAIATRPINALRNVIYFGGAFTTVAGQPRNHLAAMDDALPPSLTTWDPSPDLDIFGLARSGNTIYAMGGFTKVAGVSRNYVAALDLTGAATAWNPNPNDMVTTLAFSGSTVFVGGQFTSIGGQSHTYLAAVDNVNGNANPSWDPRPNLPPKTLGVSGDTLFVGGYLTSVGGVDRKNLAAIDVATGQPTSWNPGADADVLTMALSGGTLYIGGGFLMTANTPRRFLASFDATTGSLNSWDPSAGFQVNTLVVHGSTVYVGGLFTSMGDYARSHLAAVDASSGNLLPWNPNANDVVTSLSVVQMPVYPFDVTVYAGGYFTTIGTQTRNYVAAINGSTGQPTSFVATPDDAVLGLIVQSGIRTPITVFMAGCFLHVNGTARNRLGAVDGTGAVTAWDPNGFGCAFTLAFGPGTVYPAGGFTAVGGQQRIYIAEVDRTAGLLTPWIADADDWIQALATTGTAGGTVYVGGRFRKIDNFPHSGIAAFSESVTGVDPRPAASVADALRAAPNPFRRLVSLRFTLPGPAPAEVAIYDVAGRRVRELASRMLPAGEQVMTWDGRDDAGQRVRSGLYLARVEAGGTRLTTKLLTLQ